MKYNCICICEGAEWMVDDWQLDVDPIPNDPMLCS